MSKINELIQMLCPDGVEYKKLGELFSFKNGISKNKSFFGHGQPIINFTDVYHHVRLYNTMIKGLVDATDSELERFGVCKGDCFFTRTSETKEDIGRASVIVDDIENCVFSGFLIKGHPITDLLMPEYCSYCFNSGDFRKTIVENANMTTRATITGEILSKIEIPVPPLPVQEEIVRILDKYTELEAELEAKLSEEIELKQKQYEFYRDKLLTFEDDVERKKISNVYTRLRGTPITAGKMREIADENGDVRIFAGGKTVINAFEKDIPKANITRVPAVLVQSRGVIDFMYYDKPFTFKNEMWAYTHENTVSVQYLCYVLKNNAQKFRNEASGMGSMPQISLSVTEDFEIPVPSPTEQERIVKILDKYDTYTRDMISTLNIELESRKKQYAYYRDQLLTFKRKE